MITCQHAGADEWKDLTREFLAADIELGFTFLQIAATEYGHRHRQGGDAACTKAAQAYAEAERLVDPAEAHRLPVRELRWRLGQLRETLARFDKEERKAA